jgi:ubiquinone/menaquinone biosynthesis C-methylase UbiE
MRKRTERTFDVASSDFDSTRRDPWPSVKEIGNLKGKRVLDLGAGTGRNSKHFLDGGASVVAADISLGMLRVLGRKFLSQHGVDMLRCDATSLPFPDSVFDAVAFIAVLHHIPDNGGRRRALEEVARVMVFGGVVLVTVWAPKEVPKGARGVAAEGGSGSDIFVPWAGKGERYYHIFPPGELRELIEGAGLRVEKLYHEQVSRRRLGSNLVALASK